MALTENQLAPMFQSSVGRAPTPYEVSTYANASPQTLANLKDTFGKLNTNNSIVDYLTSIGQDPSLSNRTALGSKYGISNIGTSEGNIALLNALKSGSAPTVPGSVPGFKADNPNPVNPTNTTPTLLDPNMAPNALIQKANGDGTYTPVVNSTGLPPGSTPLTGSVSNAAGGNTTTGSLLVSSLPAYATVYKDNGNGSYTAVNNATGAVEGTSTAIPNGQYIVPSANATAPGNTTNGTPITTATTDTSTSGGATLSTDPTDPLSNADIVTLKNTYTTAQQNVASIDSQVANLRNIMSKALADKIAQAAQGGGVEDRAQLASEVAFENQGIQSQIDSLMAQRTQYATAQSLAGKDYQDAVADFYKSANLGIATQRVNTTTQKDLTDEQMSVVKFIGSAIQNGSLSLNNSELSALETQNGLPPGSLTGLTQKPTTVNPNTLTPDEKRGQALQTDAANLIGQLGAGTVSWATAWNQLHAAYPEASNDTIDALLDKDTYGNK